MISTIASWGLAGLFAFVVYALTRFVWFAINHLNSPKLFPGPGPTLSPVGTPDLAKGLLTSTTHKALLSAYTHWKSKGVKVFQYQFPGYLPLLFITDRKLAEENASKYGKSFLNRGPGISKMARAWNTPGVKLVDPQAERGLFFICDSKPWHHSRKALQPAFTPSFLHRVANPILVAMTRRWSDRLDDKLNNSPSGETTIDVWKQMNAISFDVIGMVGFGFDFEATSKDKIHPALEQFNVMLQHVIMQYLTHPLAVLLGHDLFDLLPLEVVRKRHHGLKVLSQFLDPVVEATRKRALESDDDAFANSRHLLDILTRQTKHDETMTNERLKQEIIVLLVAGSDTTANTITFALHQICANPEWQEKIYAEIDAAVGSLTGEERENTIAELAHSQKFEVTNAVLLEAMRLFPVALFGLRQTEEPIELDGVTVPAGFLLLFPHYAWMRDPDIWVDAEKFDPQRWIDDTVPHETRFDFSPWGQGARMCIGRQLAKSEMRIILTLLVDKYRMKLAPNEPAEMKGAHKFVFVPERERVDLTFSLRK